MLALITDGERNRPDATRASSSRSRQPVLNQAGVNVDRPRQRDAVDRQFLIVDAIGRKTGEQNSDQCDKTCDETQPNHSLTQTEVLATKINKYSAAAAAAINRSNAKSSRRA